MIGDDLNFLWEVDGSKPFYQVFVNGQLRNFVSKIYLTYENEYLPNHYS